MRHARDVSGPRAGAMLQVNVQVPTTINFGNLVPLSLTVGNYSSQFQVSIAVK
jgi:uncharacterized protein (TIGR03437 family)